MAPLPLSTSPGPQHTHIVIALQQASQGAGLEQAQWPIVLPPGPNQARPAGNQPLKIALPPISPQPQAIGVQLLIWLQGSGAAPVFLATTMEEVQLGQLPGHPQGRIQTHTRKTFSGKSEAGCNSLKAAPGCGLSDSACGRSGGRA